jgi:ATP-dependent Clp protease ATP-binding subunit ClpA
MRWPFVRREFDAEFTALAGRAKALARVFQHDYIGVEHYFLSLRDLPPDHFVLKILASTKIDLPKYWQDLEGRAKVVTGRPVPDSLPHTPRAETVLALSARFAEFDHCAEIGLLHFLFAVAHEKNSLPATLFAHFHASQFPQLDREQLLAEQFIGFTRSNPRGFLAFRDAPTAE